MCPESWEGGNKGHRVVRFLRKGMAVGWNIKKCQEQRVCSLSTLQGLALQGIVRLTQIWEGASKAQAAESRGLLRPVPSFEGVNERWAEKVLWHGCCRRLGNFFSLGILVSQLRTQWKPKNPCSAASEFPKLILKAERFWGRGFKARNFIFPTACFTSGISSLLHIQSMPKNVICGLGQGVGGRR